MYKKYLLILIGVVIIVGIIITMPDKGIIKKEPEIREPIIAEIAKEAFSSLIDKLNSSVNNYEASYQKIRNVSWWGGRSGATNFDRWANISIKVNNGELINYTSYLKNNDYTTDGIAEFHKFYNFSSEEMCQQKVVKNSNILSDDWECQKEIPSNFDFDMKETITKYLEGNGVEVLSMSEKENEFGHCYIFFYMNLEHIFCFNEQKIITFAQWGRNITTKDTISIDINRFEII